MPSYADKGAIDMAPHSLDIHKLRAAALKKLSANEEDIHVLSARTFVTLTNLVALVYSNTNVSAGLDHACPDGCADLDPSKLDK
jgi:hypothetical protein